MMLNTIKLLCIGVLPLAAGQIFNLILRYVSVPVPLLFVELALLVAWGCLAFIVSKRGTNPVFQAFLLSAFGLFLLVFRRNPDSFLFQAI